MKRISMLAALFLSAYITVAQDLVPKIPVYEIFSSSTCPPCKPANDYLTPLFEGYEGELAIVKYQMSWPGNGDPYYTSEGGSRRSYYAVNGVPAVFRNSVSTPYNQFTTATIDADLALEASMVMELRYLINVDSQTIRVRAHVEALGEYTDGGQRLLIPIVEHKTTLNKETNGETEFHNVFKKMLPSPQGDIIIGTINAGDVFEYDTTYVFQGDYRLPASALDPIDNEIEHSVEEFEDLHVIMFMQSLLDKEIYQGAIGVREFDVANLERPWGSDPLPPLNVADFNRQNGFGLFPNPANDNVYLELGTEQSIELVRVYAVTGELVFELGQAQFSRFELSTSTWEQGLYMVEVVTANGRFTKPLVVEH
jgi:hypothetical protein